MNTAKISNRLINEKSPYLLQHAHNPVDWYPWGEEAFSKAKAEDKPIFLSIGYSTCHWCHVMERESFESEEAAGILNKNFVSVKVDREERPDIDSIYMTVCQAFTGSGGWPMTVIMTPEKKPFYAGTYYPKDSLIELLEKITQLWKTQKTELISSGERVVNIISDKSTAKLYMPEKEIIDEAYDYFENRFDSSFGGFGFAPKFPAAHNFLFLLRYYKYSGDENALEMVLKTLVSMYHGGIYDHIGSGFSRYSTDRKWLVPHFEKMLYDNALLAMAYTEAFELTGEKIYFDVAKDVLDYIISDMSSKDGGYYSAEDADSEGEEGKFYLWTRSEVLDILGEDGKEFCYIYDISSEGNFYGKNIPNLIAGDYSEYQADYVKDCKAELFKAREKRVHPFKDDKVLTSWNGLMIAAMAMAGRAFGDEKYTDSAKKSADFILSKLMRSDGRLMAVYRGGEAKHTGYADDYVFLVWGLIELYETTFEPRYLKKALSLNDEMLRLFWDESGGGLFLYGSDAEQLIARPKETYDGAVPSGNSVAAMNFLRIAVLTGRTDLEERADELFKAFSSALTEISFGHSFMLSAFLLKETGSTEIVIAGEDTDKFINIVRSGFYPFLNIVLYNSKNKNETEKIIPFISNYEIKSKPTAYVCKNHQCMAPITDAEELKRTLDKDNM